MKLKMLLIRYLYVSICYFHYALSLPLELHNAPTIPASAVANLIKDIRCTIYGLPIMNAEMYFNGNYTIQISLMNENSTQTDNTEKNSEKGNNTVSSNLPLGYTEFSRTNGLITAYKFHSTRKTWNQARNTCVDEGGYLAYLDSAEEGQRFKDIMESTFVEGITEKIFTLESVLTKSVWMGMHDLFEEGDWVTVLGEKVSKLGYVNWGKDEPNNHGTIEHCAALERDYWVDAMMNDVSCHHKLRYFCKIRIKY